MVEEAINVVIQALRFIGAIICNLIYELITIFYQLFITVSRVNILSSDEIAPIYQRVTMILTIVMVFYITFEFVKYVIQPDTMLDKEKGVGNIVQRMIITVLLIAFVPTIFSYAYKIQNSIIENQVFSKVILGKTNTNFNQLGNQFSSNMLSLFYGIDEENCKNNNCDKAIVAVNKNITDLKTSGKVELEYEINETVSVSTNGVTKDKPMIKFDGLMAIIVGGFIIYILLLYTIDVGTRYAQLVFLQIMAPVAIISYIAPKKDNMFSKWTQKCIGTYIDLFIRLAIIYFVLLLIEVLGDAFTSNKLFAGISGVTSGIKVFTYIALVMGLLVFANKAPKMLQELFPSLGGSGIGFGLGAKERFEPSIKAAKGVASATGKSFGTLTTPGRAIAGAIRNKTGVWSAIKATGKGLAATWGKNGGYRKSKQAVRQSLHKDMDTIEEGGRPLGADIFGNHYANKAKRQDIEVANYEEVTKRKDGVKNKIHEINAIKKLKTLEESAKSSGDFALADKIAGDIKALEKAARVYSVAKTDAEKTAAFNNMKTIMETAKERTPAAGNIDVEKELERDSAKWQSVEISMQEARRVSKCMGEETVKVMRNGQEVEVKVENLTDKEFAEKIGDISDKAVALVDEMKASEDYRKSHANADKSK